MNVTHDPGFWAFMTALVGSIRWLIRAIHISIRKTNLEKNKQELSVEAMKANNTIRLVGILQETINQMKPVIEEHSKLLDGFRNSFDLMTTIENEAVQMMSNLKVQYNTFTSQIVKFNSIGDNLLGRMKGIETEIDVLKSGNLYVRTKK